MVVSFVAKRAIKLCTVYFINSYSRPILWHAFPLLMEEANESGRCSAADANRFRSSGPSFFFNVLIFKPLPSSTPHPPLPFIATFQPAQAEVKKVFKKIIITEPHTASHHLPPPNSRYIFQPFMLAVLRTDP